MTSTLSCTWQVLNKCWVSKWVICKFSSITLKFLVCFFGGVCRSYSNIYMGLSRLINSYGHIENREEGERILLISKINYKAIVTEIVSDCVLMNKQISGLEIKSWALRNIFMVIRMLYIPISFLDFCFYKVHIHKCLHSSMGFLLVSFFFLTWRSSLVFYK